MDELERDEEILANGAPEAELEQRLKRDLATGALHWSCVDPPEDVDGLGTDEDACLGMAAEVAERGSKDGDVDGTLGGRAGAEAGAADGLGNVEIVVQRDDGSVLRRVGKEDGCKERGAGARPVEGAVESVSAGDLLGREVVVPAVAREVDLGAGVALRVVLVAEAC